MAKQYIYAPINPIWMYPITTPNPNYNNLPFSLQSGLISPQKPYTQKAKSAISQTLQVLSDWIPSFKLFNAQTGVLVDTIAGATPANGVIGQTFTLYEFTITWASYPPGFYYLESIYDKNSGSTSAITETLTETTAPNFIDGNVQGKINGVIIPALDITSTGTGTATGNAGLSYSFNFNCGTTPTGTTNARVVAKITKDGTLIYQQVFTAIAGANMTKLGILQPSSIYNVICYTEDSNSAITAIDIADTNPLMPDVHIETSGIIELAANFSQALVFEYTNSVNAYSAIFSTGIIFKLIVEGNIEEYEPTFEDIIYSDQSDNVTKLNAIPNRQFSLIIGSSYGFGGIPPWMGDKVNWAMACDQILIEGQYYQNVQGSKWKVNRQSKQPNNKFIGLEITIKEVINRYLQTYQPGQLPAGSVQVITRAIPFIANSANIAISGKFTDYSLLTRIVIYNLGGNIFTLTAGTAVDGSAPITNPFTTTGQLKEVWNIDELFNGVSTLYIQGLAGTNCNIYVEYDQLDAPTVAPIVSTKMFSKGQVGMYEEVTVGDFQVDWNVGTGAGNPGTKYAGCVISGTNGTLDRNGLIAIGWNSAFPLTRDILTGNSGNIITQNASQVAAHNHLMFNSDISGLDLNDTSFVAFQKNSGVQRDYIMSKSSTTPTRGSTSTLNPTAVTPMSVANAGRITVFFVCITN